MSTRSTKLNKSTSGQPVDHRKYIKNYRNNVVRVLNSIRSGAVSEDDMDRLHNFCQMALALMETAPMAQIEKAWQHAELMSFEHADGAAYDVVYDPQKVPSTEKEKQ
jgi:hypothetical protein